MHINIDKLTESELIALNRQIINRINLLRQVKAGAEMLKFSVGESVMFRTSNGETIRGKIVRYNKKSVSIISDDMKRWTVSPGFLEKDAIDGEVVSRPNASGLSLLNLFRKL